MTAATPPGASVPPLRARRLRLHTQHEAVVVMRTDCPVCRAEGMGPRSQVLLRNGGRDLQATLFQVESDLLALDEVGLSEAAWTRLGARDGDPIQVSHPPALVSLASVRRRIHGNRLDEAALTGIVQDVVAGRYTDVHLAAFLTASSALPLDVAETTYLTRAMVAAGDRLTWDAPIVVDKHSIGGLPGNRTTPIVVAIVTALGLVMPKTSSRAITSPAGTADTMETLTRVDLDQAGLRRVVAAEGGCIAWGGSLRLSPADESFIRVERALDIDTEGQMTASVLSKKVAAGSTHVVIDIPVGPTAKVRSEEAGRRLADGLTEVAARFGLVAVCLQSDGAQPVGRGVGPALEALDVLAVLQNAPGAPDDLRRRACVLAGAVLEMGGAVEAGWGYEAAEAALADGRAWRKFERICQAQGGLRVPPRAAQTRPVTAPHAGRVVHINNRKISRLAKLAGAPDDKAAGLRMEVRLGDEVDAGQTLLVVHAETPGELAYAFDYVGANHDILEVEP